ncbi:hydroxyisourate hydrolase [Pelagibius sp. Alg239-R121]|uniref:hydroxyisourate hydrolase n=1 Tax=Pelagibius sp. Alg239-R121 TaxID=2993448 RepID=UPI0024A67393|nr:hydroxyisourate hydrolase [Pelagibius sp. Alg239-R121]
MAVVSSHTLNSVNGTHAGGIAVGLYRLAANGERTAVFQTAMDEGGRLSETVNLSAEDGQAQFELVFQTGAYFALQSLPQDGLQIMKEVVIRFTMPDPDARYHIPLMLSPNSYSVWWSS